MVYLNQFGVTVPGHPADSDNYVPMRHGEQYRIRLTNEHVARRADARVYIDGKYVGTWRIGAGTSIEIERPVDEAKCFTFFRAGTDEARTAGLAHLDDNRGLIEVEFVAERDAPRLEVVPFSNVATATCRSYQAGGTGLQGHSSQTFRRTAHVTADPQTRTVIRLRLVCADDSAITPLRAVPYSTPVPPPVHS